MCVCKKKNRRRKWGRDEHRRIKENVKETVADRRWGDKEVRHGPPLTWFPRVTSC